MKNKRIRKFHIKQLARKARQRHDIPSLQYYYTTSIKEFEKKDEGPLGLSPTLISNEHL